MGVGLGRRGTRGWLVCGASGEATLQAHGPWYGQRLVVLGMGLEGSAGLCWGFLEVLLGRSHGSVACRAESFAVGRVNDEWVKGLRGRPGPQSVLSCSRTDVELFGEGRAERSLRCCRGAAHARPAVLRAVLCVLCCCDGGFVHS